MSLKYTLFALTCRLVNASLRLLGPHTGPVVAARLAEELVPHIRVSTSAGVLRFYCPGHIPFWQAENLLAKEPDTIAWIDGFAPHDTFWDIGANVGTYTVYAALKTIRVCAFEPSAHNYHILNRNIQLNGLEPRAAAYCLALHDDTRLGDLHLSGSELGQSLHAFGVAHDWRGQAFRAAATQATLGFSIDQFIAQFSPPFPHHIKIDVDGIEDKIIAGAHTTIADPRLRSLMIELNTERANICQHVIAQLAQAGFALRAKNMVDMQTSGPFSSVFNHLFTRPA